jgi:uncharacterized protein YqeY
MKKELKEQLKVAMKAQDKVRLDTIRSILSEMQYEEMQKNVDELPSNEQMAVIQRELKKRQEAVQFEEQAKREEAKERLLAEISVIETLLPKQLSVADLEKIVSELKASTPNLSLNVVMKHLKETYAGQYDGKSASDVAKRLVG